MLGPHQGGDVFDMSNHVVNRRRAVGAQEAGEEVHAHHAAAGGQGADLVVGQVARVGTEGAAVGMGGHNGLARDGQHVVEAGVREVADVDHHAEPVHLPHHLFAQLGEAAAAAGVPGAVRQVVTLVPRQADQANPQPVQEAQDAQPPLQGLSPFDADDRGHPAGFQRSIQFLHGGHHGDAAGVLRHLPQEDIVQLHEPDQRRVGLVDGFDIVGEDLDANPRLFQPRQVDMPLGGPFPQPAPAGGQVEDGVHMGIDDRPVGRIRHGALASWVGRCCVGHTRFGRPGGTAACGRRPAEPVGDPPASCRPPPAPARWPEPGRCPGPRRR